MSLHSIPAVVKLRAVTRKLGLNTHLRRLMGYGSYEEKFDASLMQAVRPGDCVWDVGANRGFYTAKFSDMVGADGHVVAFEPGPATVQVLTREMADRANVTIQPVALGDTAGTVQFELDDTIGRVAIDGGASGLATVPVRIGDSYFGTEACGKPNVVKIDVEGFELQVLLGMTEVLRSPTTRHLAIEIHFGLLEQRNQADAPTKIERLLKSHGFKVDWCDSSHILATKQR